MRSKHPWPGLASGNTSNSLVLKVIDVNIYRRNQSIHDTCDIKVLKFEGTVQDIFSVQYLKAYVINLELDSKR